MSHRTLIGQPAPSFTLTNYDGQPFTVTPGENGVPIVLFFYPKAGTYGCTKEACQFRDAIAEKDAFKAEKVRIIGLSGDSPEAQKAFVEKHKLTYPVLSDSEGKARETYKLGKNLFGGTARTTIIIDGKGAVRDTYESTINFSAHAKLATKWLAKLEAEAAAPAPAPAEVAPAADAPAAPTTDAPAA